MGIDFETESEFPTTAKPAKSQKQPAPTAPDAWGDSVETTPAESSGGWGDTLDLGAQKVTLPEPGWRRATVSKVSVMGVESPALWCSITYTFEHEGRQYSCSEMNCFAAKPESPHVTRVDDGRRMLNRLAAATGVTLHGKFREWGDLFEGCQVWIRTTNGVRDGVAEIQLRAVKKSPPPMESHAPATAPAKA